MIIDVQQIKVTLRSGDICVEPMKMAVIKKFSEAVKPVFGQLAEMATNKEKQQNIPELITEHYDDLAGLVCIASPVTKDAIDNMYPDEFIQLVGACIEVNADFFMKSLMPALKETLDGLRIKLNPDQMMKSGPMDSSS